MTSPARPRRSARVAAAIRSVPGRGKRAAVTVALVGATVLAGPLPAAEADGATAASYPVVDEVATAAEDELAAGLAAEYTGAVDGHDVTALVHGVSRRLQGEALSPRLTLLTTEAVSRRALTDHLARGTALPS
ncbi:hypothetical protein QWJ41_05735 [Nocardioides sp. SOB44]|uniref:S1 family peptidase n=1 Tax=Nocardioides cremeus TaxID=3058044 RepID=A0ABT8TMM6_9ACTN|nr:hypothetical protein [Nocardioides cremeus]MDO3395210.1 hypothetical protein [Nocardioides cremeus]